MAPRRAWTAPEYQKKKAAPTLVLRCTCIRLSTFCEKSHQVQVQVQDSDAGAMANPPRLRAGMWLIFRLTSYCTLAAGRLSKLRTEESNIRKDEKPEYLQKMKVPPVEPPTNSYSLV